MSAPTSNITLNPIGLEDGHSIAIAGRFTPVSLRSLSILIAIKAPVLPQETQTLALPSLTDSMADHIEVAFPCLTTWLGLSSIFITSRLSTIVTLPAKERRLFTNFLSSSLLPCKRKCILSSIFAARTSPATMADGPKSPPIASMLIVVPECTTSELFFTVVVMLPSFIRN